MNTNRPQRNHILLLHLHDADLRISRSRFRRSSSRKRYIPIFRRCTERPHISALRLSAYQRIRRISALRRRNDIISLAPPIRQLRVFHHYLLGLTSDFQILGRLRSHENCWIVCCAVPGLRDCVVDLRYYAGYSGGQYAAGSLAIGRSHFRCFLPHYRPSHPIRILHTDL